MEKGNRKIKKDLLKKFVISSLLTTFAACGSTPAVKAQEQAPAPSAPRTVTIPNAQEQTLPNGLKIVVVERRNVPLVTASLLVGNGAKAEDEALAGVADMTASLLLKGTKTRNATQIAEQIEFLGGDINSSAGWSSSNVGVNVTSDKLDSALAIMSDVVLNPTFPQSEIDLYKSQTLDDLNVQLKQPLTLANFAAVRYTFGEHSAVGTPESITKIKQTDILKFYMENFKPNYSVLIFTGDISPQAAGALAQKYFGVWKSGAPEKNAKAVRIDEPLIPSKTGNESVINRILVVDMPNSGQAAVTYAKKLNEGRISEINSNGKMRIADSNIYYPSLVTNSILGGDFSARLNEEIRIKRGLSYGAGSSFSWRDASSNFLARAQTKNVSAAEVAELMAAEINKLTTNPVLADELTPRKANLTGKFGRNFETTNGLAAQIADLYLYGLKPAELNSYLQIVQKVSGSEIKNFAASNLKGGDIIIVGDYKIFADDLKKRFPNQKIDVIPASQLNLNSDNLRKG